MSKLALKKNAIVVIGGWLIKKNGRWQTTGFDGNFGNGTVGDRLRVLASYYLYNKNNRSLIIASGGKGKLRKFKGVPSIASVIKRELTELGIPGDGIIIEGRSDSTYENLRNLIRIAKARRLNGIIVVSNRYHLPRIKAMVKYAPGLNELSKIVHIKYCEAEVVVIKNNPSWRSIIQNAYARKEMKDLILKEKKGVKDLKSGNYRSK